MKYKVIGKLSDKKVKDLFFPSENLEETFLNEGKKNRYENVGKFIVGGAVALVFTTAFGDVGFAATEPMHAYKELDKLDSIFAFIDWLIWLARIIISSVIGLITTYAGWKWSTDLSSGGVSDAKKILKNCAWGMFWVQFGATIANFFVDKMQSLV